MHAIALTVVIIMSLGSAGPVFRLPADARPAVNLTGEWRVRTSDGDVRMMTLTQKDGILTGEVDNGEVAGKVHGDQVKVWLVKDPQTVGAGTIQGDVIEGTFESSQEERGGDWRATRELAEE